MLILEGEVNDYVGKGMYGGEIIIKLFVEVGYDFGENVIVGNICLYGVIGGVFFVNG